MFKKVRHSVDLLVAIVSSKATVMSAEHEGGDSKSCLIFEIDNYDD